MSEHTPQHHESYGEQLVSAEHQAERALPTHEQAMETAKAEAKQHHELQEARTNVEQHAAEQNPVQAHEAAEKAASEPQVGHVNRELKAITLRRELKNLQRQLPAPQRALSKVIHQPAVRAVSEVAGASISRPSGLLGGGLVALIGSTGYLYLAKHIGFSYNFFVFILLFVAGFIVGLVLELLVWSLTRHRRVDL